MSYAIYNINASTSVVQVPTSNLSTTSFTPVVLLNSVNAPGQLVTIRDFEGAASLQYPITVSTVNGVNFLEGPQVSSYTITQPFGFMTVSPRTPSIWNVMNTFAFPDSNAAANINTLNANLMVASSIYASGEVNMSSLNVSTLTVLQYLDIASTNIENAIVQSNVYVGELLSTGIFFAGDASTLNLTVTQVANVSTLSSVEAFIDTLTVSNFVTSNVNVPNIMASTVKTERVFLSVSSPNESGTITWGQISTGNHLELIAGTGTGGEGYIDFYTGVGNDVSLTDYTNRAVTIQAANDATSTLRVFGGARVANDLYVGGETRFQASTFFIENATFQKDVFVSTQMYIGPNPTSSSRIVIYGNTEEKLKLFASNTNAVIQHTNTAGTNDTPYIGFGGDSGNMNVRDTADNRMINFSSFAQGIDVDCVLNMSSGFSVLGPNTASSNYIYNTTLFSTAASVVFNGAASLTMTDSAGPAVFSNTVEFAPTASTIFSNASYNLKTLTVGNGNYIKIYSSTPTEGGAMHWNEVLAGQGMFELYSSKGGGPLLLGNGGFAFYTAIQGGTPAALSNLAMRIYAPGLDATTLVVDGGGTFTSTVIANNFTSLGSNNATNFLYGNTHFGDLGEVRLSNGFSSIGGTATFTNTVNFSNATVQGLPLSNTTFTGTANFSNANVQGLSFSLPVVNL